MGMPSEGLDSSGFVGRLCRGIREHALLCNTVAVLVLALLDMNSRRVLHADVVVQVYHTPESQFSRSHPNPPPRADIY